MFSRPTSTLRGLASILLCSATLLAPEAQAQQRFVLHGNGRLAIVEKDGTESWQMRWGGIHDLHVLPNGNLLTQHGWTRISEIDVSRKQVVWTYDAKPVEGERMEIHSMQPLAGGGVMIAESGRGRIIEVDRMGKITNEIKLVLDKPHPHSDTRSVRKLESGNYLVSHERDGKVREYDMQGALIWEYAIPLFGRKPAGGHGPQAFGNKCFDAMRLANGNTLIATGNGHSVLEVSPAKEIVWKIEQNDLPGITLAWVTTLEVLENGNYVIGNCHAGPGQPLLIEIVPATKKVVWQFDGHENYGNNVSNSRLLDVGPEADVVAHARALHAGLITIDTHKDISANLASEEFPEDAAELERFLLRNDPTRWGNSQVDFPKMRAGGYDAGFYIVYVGQGSLDADGFARAKKTALSKFEAIHRMVKRFPEHIGLARTPADVKRLAAEGKLIACIGIENGYVMGEDLSLVAKYHEMGARYMSLTHNRHSQLGDSHMPADEPLHGGLTELGAKAIAEMNRHGIMVDVSHASKQTMLDALVYTQAPVIASHSGVGGVYAHGRNLDDEQLLALKKNGGVIQCVAFASYVKDDSPRRAAIAKLRKDIGLAPQRRRSAPADTSPAGLVKLRKLREGAKVINANFPPSSVKDLADHIDHAVQLIGINHVAISSDFDGGGGVVGWNNASETFNVTLELVRRGYSDEDIAKLWSGNTLRVWSEVEAIAQRIQKSGK